MERIDLNVDLGEGMGNDPLIMPYITRCNIACGGHYGDERTIASALQLALNHGVKAGAHPSFEDKENFGRVFIDVGEVRFRESVITQINRFKTVASGLNMAMSHVKMHGALYHATAHDQRYAQWTVALFKEQFAGTALMLPPKSVLYDLCKTHKIPTITEAFADRRYLKNGNLVPRTEPNAVITDVPKLVNQLTMMVREKCVRSTSETVVAIDATSFCIHGDNEAIVHDLPEVVALLKQNNIAIAQR